MPFLSTKIMHRVSLFINIVPVAVKTVVGNPGQPPGGSFKNLGLTSPPTGDTLRNNLIWEDINIIDGGVNVGLSNRDRYFRRS